LTSIRFQKNLSTLPKKLTYDNFAKNQLYVAAITNGCLFARICLIPLLFHLTEKEDSVSK